MSTINNLLCHKAEHECKCQTCTCKKDCIEDNKKLDDLTFDNIDSNLDQFEGGMM
jgi:hypothetical protein